MFKLKTTYPLQRRGHAETAAKSREEYPPDEDRRTGWPAKGHSREHTCSCGPLTGTWSSEHIASELEHACVSENENAKQNDDAQRGTCSKTANESHDEASKKKNWSRTSSELFIIFFFQEKKFCERYLRKKKSGHQGQVTDTGHTGRTPDVGVPTSQILNLAGAT